LISRVLTTLEGVSTATSATTRARRAGERDGVEYHFLERAAFEQRIAAGEFLEHAEYAGNLYGTLRSEVEGRVGRGESVILEIELQGARSIRETLPDALAIFIAPPSLDELARRLEGRGTEAEADIAARLQVAEQELAARQEFEYLVINDNVERASEELIELIRRTTTARVREETTGG
jgi:guanylate kinase